LVIGNNNCLDHIVQTTQKTGS